MKKGGISPTLTLFPPRNQNSIALSSASFIMFVKEL